MNNAPKKQSALALEQELAAAAAQIAAITGRDDLAEMFVTLMENTLQTTLTREADGTTFVITGDIPAMWLRDSSAQLLPFLRFLQADAEEGSEAAELADVVAGLVTRQFAYIALDTYANAFNQEANGASYDPHDACGNPWVWEQKYEIDSFAFPITLAWDLWQRTGRDDFLTPDVVATLRTIVSQLRLEQDHENSSPYRFVRQTDMPSETLSRDGLGAPVGHTGMTWQGFRPSDDACVYGYNVPGNLFIRQALLRAAELAEHVGEVELADAARVLSAEIAAGVAAHGIVIHPLYGRIFAYEVDGLGGVLLMDDANMPSLLSLPMTGGVDPGDPVYVATRQFILSGENPFFYEGTFVPDEAGVGVGSGSKADAVTVTGIGSPHTPPGHIWHIALAVQGLTTPDVAEKLRMIELMAQTTGGAGMMHEGFNPLNPQEFTRPWFSWANSMFCELLLDYVSA